MLHCSACCLARLRVLMPLSTSIRLPFTCIHVNHYLSFEHSLLPVTRLLTHTLKLLTSGLALHATGPSQTRCDVTRGNGTLSRSI